MPKFLTGKIPEWRNHFSRLWLARNLNHHFDLVYAFVYLSELPQICLLDIRKKGTRFIAHIADHSLDFETPLAIEILAQSDPMISISKSMKSHFKQMLKQTEIEVIHNGPEDQCFRLFEDRTRNPNKKKIFTITF